MERRSFSRLPDLPRVAALVLVATFVAACGSSAASAGAPTSEATPTATPTMAATDSPATAASLPADLPTGVANSLDPCVLVSASEASALTGASYTAGKLETSAGGGKTCWYGSQTKNVFEVVVAQAPDVATAQKVKDTYLAEVGAATGGLPIKPVALSGLGDAAEFISFSALSINAVGIYVLKGAIFFALVDEVTGAPAPTQAAMVAEAQAVLGRLP
jgi:hypothetical protein